MAMQALEDLYAEASSSPFGNMNLGGLGLASRVRPASYRSRFAGDSIAEVWDPDALEQQIDAMLTS
jgi:hypothetical protein